MSSRTTYTSTELGADQDERFERGVALVRGSVREHQLLIGGRLRPGRGERIEVRNPAARGEVLSAFGASSDDDVVEAVAAARAAQRGWARTDMAERIAVLRRAADGIGRRAGELGALLCLEVGKNRLEAMGEVDEAVELIRYYGAQAAEGFDIPLATDVACDRNVSVLRPFGVFGVIAPFNFPLALVLGPSVAALLGGNTVVAKPSPTTSAVAVVLGEVLLEAGLPPGAYNVVLGDDDAGRALVGARGLDGIVFTGSYAVGQSIARRFLTDVGYARPCIVEMGGKNPAVVSRSADLAVAAEGILRSAFGLSGQKCSACSRCWSTATCHDELLAAARRRRPRWHVGRPVDRPAASGRSTRRRRSSASRVTAMAARDGGDRVRRRGLPDVGDGWFVQPTIVADPPSARPPPAARGAVSCVLAVERVDASTTLRRANGSQVLRLTAGFFAATMERSTCSLAASRPDGASSTAAAGATSGGWPGNSRTSDVEGSGYRRAAVRSGSRATWRNPLREQGRNVVR
jgi:1-pyrroline-5-carboxylate dehydrogenase